MNDATYITKMRLLQTSFDDTSGSLAITSDKFTTDDRSADNLGGVDNLLDTGYTESDVHGSDTSKMESLLGHLGTWFTNRLGSDSTNGRTGFDFSLDILRPADI